MVEGISLQNVQTKSVLTLDMVSTSDYVLDSVDWGAVESTHHSYKYVNQNGVYVVGSTLETRPVTITGWVVANNEKQMTSRKTLLNRFVNPKQAINLFYKDYVLNFIPNASIKYSAVKQENNDVMCKFKIEGFCPDPLFKEELETKVAAASTAGKFHFPLVISKTPKIPGGVVFGVRQPSLIAVAENKGSVPVGIKLTFKANGTLKNPMIINVETQEFFKINKVMEAGEVIEIDTTSGQKSVQGTFNGITSNYYKYRDFDSSWLQLEVGDNLFRYDAEENIENLEVYINFNNRYLEVQECN